MICSMTYVHIYLKELIYVQFKFGFSINLSSKKYCMQDFIISHAKAKVLLICLIYGSVSCLTCRGLYYLYFHEWAKNKKWL